jgi:phenylalanyl-tRNA synthetase alpha chain
MGWPWALLLAAAGAALQQGHAGGAAGTGASVPPGCRLAAGRDAGVVWLARQRRLQLRGGASDADADADAAEAAAAAPTMQELMGPKSNIVQAIAAKVGRNLHNKVDHPLHIIKTWIMQHFSETFVGADGAPLFDLLDSLSPVVTTAMCFDDLLTPPDHPSRSRSDTYYLDETRLLRSHMTAHQTTLLREGRRSFLFAGDVYRRDAVDACHYPCFHQMDGVRVYSWQDLGVASHEEAIPIVLEDLKTTLSGMVASIFGDVEMKWVESTFPFTEPSLELEILFQGKWLEVLGCGVMRSKILQNGSLFEHTGWAFGLGLERLAMILFQVPDIRLFWTEDERFTSQFVGAVASGRRELKFEPFSKYPMCYKDVSFWHPAEFHENDFAELVRTVCGDLAEDVQKVDSFVHPKTQRHSSCFRICYRAMDRTLTNEEVDALQAQFCAALVAELSVELR